MVLIDLTKAFDSVHGESLWKISKKIGCLLKFVNNIRSFHDGMFGCVLDNDVISTPFNVTQGTKAASSTRCSLASSSL